MPQHRMHYDHTEPDGGQHWVCLACDRRLVYRDGPRPGFYTLTEGDRTVRHTLTRDQYVQAPAFPPVTVGVSVQVTVEESITKDDTAFLESLGVRW